MVMNNYILRPMKFEDISLVAICASESYTDGLYSIDHIQKMWESSKFTSYIAENISNDIIGHVALKLDDKMNTSELCAAFVSPFYRGNGCLKDLAQFAMEEGSKQNITSFYVQSVSSHPYSQSAASKSGFKDCGILLAKIKKLAYANSNLYSGIRESLILSHRNSTNYYSEYRKLMVCHVPVNHLDMVRNIFDYHLFETNLSVKKINNPQNIKSVISKETNDFWECADLTIHHYGEDYLRIIEVLNNQLFNQNYESVVIKLPLSDMFTPYAINELENLGFFFAGILPTKNGNPLFILQKLGSQIIDFKSLKIYSDFAEQLLSYIKSEYTKTTNRRTVFNEVSNCK